MAFRVKIKECSRFDFGIDYNDETVFPADDEIESSEWEAGDGITIDEDSFTDRSTTVFVAPVVGSKGQKFTVTNIVETAAGRRDCNKFIFTVV